MIRYNYVRFPNRPPAPFVNVCLSVLNTIEPCFELAALIDTGADRTVIPKEFVDLLGLKKGTDDFITIAGITGEAVEAPLYFVNLAIKGFSPRPLESIFLEDEEQQIVLGRDFLNHHQINLNGPNLTFTVEA